MPALLRFREDLLEMAANGRAVRVENEQKAGQSAKPIDCGDLLALVVSGRQAVRLGVVDVLQAVFEAAQELVGGRQFALGLGRQQATFGEQGEDLQVGRICRAGSRPPRINWKTWAMNSISRMPPGPSLMCSAMSLRATSRRIWACRSRMALIAPKSRYLRKTKGGRCSAGRRPIPAAD
jgi:hypothetical protein